MDLSDVSTASQFVPFITGVIVWRKYKLDKPTLIFLLILGIWTITELISLVFNAFKWHNHILLNSHWILSTVLLFYYFYLVCKLGKNTLYILITAFIFYCIINLTFFGSIWIWNMAIVYLGSFLIIVFSANSLILMVNDATHDLFRQPVFWISTTLLFYYTVALVSFSLFPEAVTSADPAWRHFWSVHDVVNITSNLLCSYAFICRITGV